MKYLSLFSGVEAATQAWKPLGWECVAVSEIEPFPCAVLEHHYPDVPNLGDVTKITEEQIKALGQIDLVVFGSPCQNLSVAGNRKGLQGEQSSLFYSAMEVIRYARENNNLRFALWENVPGCFSSNKGSDFSAVVEQMAGLEDIGVPKNGWGKEGAAVGSNGLLEWSVLDAQFFGLAQRRKRVFALLDFGDWQSRPPVLLEPESLRGDTPPSRETRKDTATDIKRGFREGGFGEFVESPIAGTLKASGGVLGGGSETVAIAGNIISRSHKHGGNGNGFDDSGACYTLTTTDKHAIAYSIIADATPKIGEEINGTLRSSGGGGIVPPGVAYNSVVRRLTPIECERLQGFPDGLTKIPYKSKSADDCPKSPRYKAIGNSMAVPVMAWIGKQIDKAAKD